MEKIFKMTILGEIHLQQGSYSITIFTRHRARYI